MLKSGLLAERYAYSAGCASIWDTRGSEHLDQVRHKIRAGRYVAEHHACTVCGNDDYLVIAERDRYGLPICAALCRVCGLLQTNPRLRREDFVDFYTNHFFGLYRSPFRATEELFKQRTWHGATILRFLKNHSALPKNGLVVEIGCGSGGILHRFAEAGYRVIGVDYSSDVIAHAKRLNLDLRVGDLFNLELDEQPDLIIYSQVLEHVHDPNAELVRARELLSDRGRLYIEVPGVLDIRTNSVQADLLRFLHIAHTTHFSLTTLTNLLAKNGFERVGGNEEVQAVFRKGAYVKTWVSDFEPTLRYLKETEQRRALYRTVFRVKAAAKAVVDGVRSSAVAVLKGLGVYAMARRLYQKIP